MTHSAKSTLNMVAPAGIDRDWLARAECRDADPELWFSDNPVDIDQAYATCRACPIATTCLDWATRTNQTAGMWGGRRFPQCSRQGCTEGAAPWRKTCPRHDVPMRSASDTCAEGHPYEMRADGKRGCRICKNARTAATRRAKARVA